MVNEELRRFHTQLKAGELNTAEKLADGWDRTYAGGHWDFLGELPEAARYGLIATYFVQLAPVGASVLDVGCGNGVLNRYLGPFGYGRYVGLDLSQAAIDLASRARTGNASFRVGDFETMLLDGLGSFDIVILNEVLYYFARPADALRRVSELLAPGGTLIVSRYGVSDVAVLDEDFTTLDEVVVRHTATAKEWRVRCCRARAPSR